MIRLDNDPASMHGHIEAAENGSLTDSMTDSR